MGAGLDLIALGGGRVGALIGDVMGRGRGPALVDVLASAWGTLPTEHGKAVWFSLPLPPVRD